MERSELSNTTKRFVIALGGNAIIPVGMEGTYEQQLDITRQTMDTVAKLALQGHEIVMTHGNGPVVGNIVLRCAAGRATISDPLRQCAPTTASSTCACAPKSTLPRFAVERAVTSSAVHVIGLTQMLPGLPMEREAFSVWVFQLI